EEANNILISYPKANNYIKKLIGAKEFLDGNSRWCIWVEDFEYNKARNIPPLNERFENVKNLRLQSKDEGARKLANTPHQFRDTKTTQTESIVVPLTTSERRHYIPIGLTKRDEILSNALSVIYDGAPYLIGILSSKIHVIWTKAVGGTLESR